MIVFFKIPYFAKDYPERAQTLDQARLNFYCCNCYRKKDTIYLTGNFGPFCYECLTEIMPLLPDDFVKELKRFRLE